MKTTLVDMCEKMIGALEANEPVEITYEYFNGEALCEVMTVDSVELFIDSVERGDFEEWGTYYAPNQKNPSHRFSVWERRKSIDELKAEAMDAAMLVAEEDKLTGKKIIKTASGSLLNNMFLKRGARTLSTYQVPYMSYAKNKDGLYKLVYRWIRLPESRLTRFFDSSDVLSVRNVNVPLKDGTDLIVHNEYKYKRLKGDPIVIMDFMGETKSPKKAEAYLESRRFLKEGITPSFKKQEGESEKKEYEYCQSSASGQRTLKGVFVRKDYRFTDEYLEKFEKEDTEEFEEFMDTMRSLRGAEVLYAALSYGSYLIEFKNVPGNIAKFISRMGMSQTSSKSMGNDFKVLHMGDVKIFPKDTLAQKKIWVERLKPIIWDYLSSLRNKNGEPLMAEKKKKQYLKLIWKHWKSTKLDGQSFITDEAVVRGFARIGVRTTQEKVVGKLLQFRWAGVKGTALCLPEDLLASFVWADGTPAYEGYDLIVEHNSWKYTPDTKHWKGELAPELELVAISKSKFSNSMTYQAVLALDGDGTKEIIDNMKEVVQRGFDRLKESLTSPEIYKLEAGMVSTDERNDFDDFSVDEFESSQRTAADRAIAADERILKDESFMLKHIDRKTKMKDDMGYGKFPVEGATRYIISDVMGMFATRSSVPRLDKKGERVYDHEGNPMWDIVVDDVSLLGLQGTNEVYWNGTKGPGVLFRSPCTNPGEPQIVKHVSLETIPEFIGEIPARQIYGYIKDIIVINVVSCILDCLGGADTDGDKVLDILEPTIVKLRNPLRLPTLVSLDTKPRTPAPINPEAVKAYAVESLKDAGIGIITDIATTIRDISLMTSLMPGSKGERKLPVSVKNALLGMAQEAEMYLKDHCPKKEDKNVKEPGVIDDDMVNAPKDFTDKDLKIEYMSDDEIKACEALAALIDPDRELINDDKRARQWRTAVIHACEACLLVLRKLQEMAIDVPKSGVFIDFDKYRYLMIKLRASWHRPNAWNGNYDSWSTMGCLKEFVEKKYEEIKVWAVDTSKKHPVGDMDITGYKAEYAQIRAMKVEYGKTMKEMFKDRTWKTRSGISINDLSEDEVREERRKVTDEYTLRLATMAETLGSVEIVSSMVYRSLYDNSKSIYSADGYGFLWAAWGSKFADTLKHMNSDLKEKRLVIVKQAKEYKEYVLPSGSYSVQDGNVSFIQSPEETLGYCKVPDGIYEMIVHDEEGYLLVEKERRVLTEEISALKGTNFTIIGIPNYRYREVPLERKTVIELLEKAGYKVSVCIGETGKTKSDGSPADPRAMVFVKTTDGDVCIGNLPGKGSMKEEYGYLSSALHEKIVKLRISDNANKKDKSRDGQMRSLSLTVVDVEEEA